MLAKYSGFPFFKENKENILRNSKFKTVRIEVEATFQSWWLSISATVFCTDQ